MWGVTRRAPMTRAVTIPEYDRPLVTALVMAKSPRLALGRAAVHPHHGLGAVAKVIVGHSSDDLEWLEAATTALGAQVIYLPIRRSDNRTAERERQLAMADAMSDVAYADEQAKAADAIIAGVSQHATDRELRRIVGEGRTLRRRCLDRDLELTDQYVTHGSVDQAIVTERAADRRRYEELRDEYLLMNGGEPTTWPL